MSVTEHMRDADSECMRRPNIQQHKQRGGGGIHTCIIATATRVGMSRRMTGKAACAGALSLGASAAAAPAAAGGAAASRATDAGGASSTCGRVCVCMCVCACVYMRSCESQARKPPLKFHIKNL